MIDLPFGFLLFLFGLVAIFAVAVALFGDSNESTAWEEAICRLLPTTTSVAATCASCETDDVDAEDCFCDDCGESSETLEWRADGQVRCARCQGFRDFPDLAREVLADGGFVPDLIVSDLGLDFEEDTDAEPDGSDAVSSAADAAPAIDASAGKVLPPYKRILEATGWWPFVDQNIDVVQFYSYTHFCMPNGTTAVGLAQVYNGFRYADIAIANRSDVAVAWTIVHEASHLSSVGTTGDLSWDEQAAEAAAARFLQDAAAVFGREACR